MVHPRNLQFIVIEIEKALHNLSPPLMFELLNITSVRVKPLFATM